VHFLVPLTYFRAEVFQNNYHISLWPQMYGNLVRILILLEDTSYSESKNKERAVASKDVEQDINAYKTYNPLSAEYWECGGDRHCGRCSSEVNGLRSDKCERLGFGDSSGLDGTRGRSLEVMGPIGDCEFGSGDQFPGLDGAR
jgi:hypothetical protein